MRKGNRKDLGRYVTGATERSRHFPAELRTLYGRSGRQPDLDPITVASELCFGYQDRTRQARILREDVGLFPSLDIRPDHVLSAPLEDAHQSAAGRPRVHLNEHAIIVESALGLARRQVDVLPLALGSLDKTKAFAMNVQHTLNLLTLLGVLGHAPGASSIGRRESLTLSRQHSRVDHFSKHALERRLFAGVKRGQTQDLSDSQPMRRTAQQLRQPLGLERHPT